MARCDRYTAARVLGPSWDLATSLWRVSLAVGLCLLLASCGGEASLVGPGSAGSPSAEAPATAATTPGTATPAGPAVGPIVWTTAVDPRTSAPADEVTTYAPEAPRLVAAAPVRGLPGGATLTASWSYNDTSLDAFATNLALTTSAEQTWVSFYIARSDDSLWPEGVYEIAISLAGREVARSTVEVVAPA